MPQPLPKRITEANPEINEKRFNTLLVDGSNILELSCRGCEKFSSNGENIGGVFQFLLQLKLLLKKGNFRYVYVFWDGERSGRMRWLLNKDYKGNRDKDFGDDESVSDYMKKFNAKLSEMQKHAYGKNGRKSEDGYKEYFFKQREYVMLCLEELFVRQCVCDEVEADDLIGYYVSRKKRNERIVICSNDRDLTQLISEDVIVYVQSMHDFLTSKNHVEKTGIHHSNVLLKKIICGDSSDNIKGIRGVGETTLLDNFPDLKKRPMSLNEVIDGARKINDDRAAEKKKPLKWAYNIVNAVTEGYPKEKIYEVNRKIIDLKHPMVTREASELLDSMMYAPIDPEGRSFANLYEIISDIGIDDLKSESAFGNFFLEFKYLIDNEKHNSQ